MDIEQKAINMFLKNNDGYVFAFRWFNNIGEEYFMCEQFFLVKDTNIWEIQHDQTLVKDEIEFNDIDKCFKIGKYNKEKKYIWNNYYFDANKLKKISKPSFI